MRVRIGIPDLISPSYFPAIAGVELGCFEREGLDATVDLVFPVTKTYEQLRNGDLEVVVGAAHAALYAFEGWRGCRLVAAASRGMYWFLVVRPDLGIKRGDLRAIEGLRIGAAPGPVDGLREMLRAVGLDPDDDVAIQPVPGTGGSGVSFGVTAAEALSQGLIDGFWANGMGAEVAVRAGSGTVILDARRGDGPTGSEHYTFPAVVVTEPFLRANPDVVAAVVRGIRGAHELLRADPDAATLAAERVFPDYEQRLIATLIERDAPFYDHRIAVDEIAAVNRFASGLGLLANPDIPAGDILATDLEVGQ